MLRNNKNENTQTKKPLYKKWWFWVIAVLVIAGIGGKNEKKEEPSKQVEQAQETKETKQTEVTKEVEPVIYLLDSNSKFRKVITLNKDTDSPVDKIIYKVPAGKYKATTEFKKVATFGVIKDKTNIVEGKYPEELNYVTEMCNITGRPENFTEEQAKAEVIIKVAADESVLVPNDNIIKLEAIK